MKKSALLPALLITMLGVTLPPLTTLAQDPPARTFQPGPWQPVARVDISRPIEIQIFNNTGLMLDYDLTANINPSPRQIQPGETTTLKGFTLPAYILVNRSVSAASRSEASLVYQVSVESNNVVKLTITQAAAADPGYSTLNIDRKGAIYIY